MVESRRSDIFKPGDLLNNTYRIEQVLGRGGTSEVYKARNEVSGRFIAIKALKSEFSGDEGFLTLMRREEEIREIRHDAVVRYSENHRTPDGHIYLVMDYVEGPPLDTLMKSGGMSADDLLAVCTRVAQGLRVAHNRNIVHRDLSPDNIILRGGKPEEAVIIDFGIAKDTNPGAETIVGSEFAGKYAYAAPEQLSGNTDRRTDLYSLGALLLATFRGATPDVGRNPMEVLQKKALPLDTSGVPEPLKSLIDRMSAPDPAQRFQTAEELLNALNTPIDEGTVIVPRRPQTILPPATPGPADPISPLTTAKPAARSAPAIRKLPEPKGRGGMIAIVAVVLLAGAGAAGFFAGAFDSLLGPRLPVADPYALTIERPSEGPASAVGNVPDELTLTGITTAMQGMGGTADLTLATGSIAETWGVDVLSTLDALAPVDQWQMSISGNTGAVTGITNDPAVLTTVMAALGTDLPGALDGRATIQQGPVILSTSAITQVLEAFADCGPLTQVDAPDLGYPMGSTITVSGVMATVETKVGLTDALTAIAGDRTVLIATHTLNPQLCLIEQDLPDAPTGGVGFKFGFGDRPEDNPNARYYVDENPVIDVILPADMVDGYLSVSLLDVSGNVFHLLPNLNRTDNAVASLRNGQTGEVPVRIAYSLAERTAATESKSAMLVFTVDDTILGKSRIIVLHSDRPLFPDLRPTTESAGGFAEALKEEIEAGGNILSFDSHILLTEQP